MYVVVFSTSAAIQQHIDQVVQTAGTAGISFNAVGTPVVQNVPLTTLSLNDFVNPITAMMQTRFLTAVAAGKVMMQQKSGVILSLTATPGGIGYPYTCGFALPAVPLKASHATWLQNWVCMAYVW
ncbi:hypothetical protein [Deminuibacter soli]|uniref:SDR family NAD(P)-dependent oxidoreductase n=1 Tax=Deminuibacter soli TaxID=2291815 RepID=A0A3E1NK50_9BACT|nr:hypothetical protein [Deminuibacter soli]RFM28302.1 hypothetical protein DXN05_12385 [Deminuibacter soli]